MENRNLGRGRVSVPVVGLGTWRRLEAAASGRHRELTGAAIAAGIGLFDTSPMYGEAERLLADALDGQRGQVLIADKISAGSQDASDPHERLHPGSALMARLAERERGADSRGRPGSP